MLTIIDGSALTLLCFHYGLAVDAAKTLKEEGTTTVDERGLTRKHPACQILRDNSQAFKQYMQEFGLSPSSRARLDVKEKKEPSEFLKFFGDL